ncbi:hypothetical protein Bca4012_007166 [Brassica carinata]
MFTSIVGNVFGFKALADLRLEDLGIPPAYNQTFQRPLVAGTDGDEAGRCSLFPGTGRLQGSRETTFPLSERNLDRTRSAGPLADTVTMLTSSYHCRF